MLLQLSKKKKPLEDTGVNVTLHQRQKDATSSTASKKIIEEAMTRRQVKPKIKILLRATLRDKQLGMRRVIGPESCGGRISCAAVADLYDDYRRQDGRGCHLGAPLAYLKRQEVMRWTRVKIRTVRGEGNQGPKEPK